MALIMAHALVRNCPGSPNTFMSSCPVAKARVVPAAAQVPDREDVLISDALKLAL